MDSFNYENTETKVQTGGKIVRKVTIKRGKGYKSVTKYHKGKKISTFRKPVHKNHVSLIKIGKFIPGFFSDCCKKSRRNKKGGDYNGQPSGNTERQRKFAQLQSLMRENRENMERYQELDDRLYEIEELTPEERESRAQEENELTRQIDELREVNNQSQQRFEQLRNEYIQEYGSLTMQ